MILIEPERSSFRRWGRRSPRNARSDSPVYEASKQTWEFRYSLGAKKLDIDLVNTSVETGVQVADPDHAQKPVLRISDSLVPYGYRSADPCL